MDSSHGTKKWIGECDLTKVNKEVCRRAGNCLTFCELQNLVIPSGTLSFCFFFSFPFCNCYSFLANFLWWFGSISVVL